MRPKPVILNKGNFKFGYYQSRGVAGKGAWSTGVTWLMLMEMVG